MELSKPNKIQILNDVLEVIEATIEKLKEMDIDKIDKFHMLIAIIGVTGSGKSLILNKLFNCGFDVKTKEQTSRVTVGGWLNFWKEFSITK